MTAVFQKPAVTIRSALSADPSVCGSARTAIVGEALCRSQTGRSRADHARLENPVLIGSL